MSFFVTRNTLNNPNNFNIGIYQGGLLLVLLLLGGCGGTSISSSDSPDMTSDAVSDNKATLTWQSPTKNADGSPIDDLAGHVIYMSSASGVYNLNDIVSNIPISTVAGGTSETFTISDLTPGTHYFQITAYNAAGFESAPSVEVHKTIQ